jgi:hypothetical protein
MGQFQAFLSNSDQHIGADGDPDLRLHRVLARAVESLDAQMLLDPLEEQLHLPALAVQSRDQLGLEREVVGQKRDPLATLVFDHHAAQYRWIVLVRVEHCQHARLIADHAGRCPVHRAGVTPFEPRVALGTRHKEALGLGNGVQALEIQIPPVEQIERARLDAQLVQRVDLVSLAIGDVNESRDIAPQIQKRVQAYRCLGTAKRCPRKHRKTQIDGRRIEGIHGGIQFDGQWLAGVQRARNADEMLSQIGIDLPRACHVRVGQRVARNRGAAKAHVIQALALSAQIDLDIAQRLSVGQLREGHSEELIQAGEVLDFEVALMGCNAAAKSAQWQMRHQLSEHELALMHGGLGRKNAQNRESDIRRSNRDQMKMLKSAGKSLTYDVLM